MGKPLLIQTTGEVRGTNLGILKSLYASINKPDVNADGTVMSIPLQAEKNEGLITIKHDSIPGGQLVLNPSMEGTCNLARLGAGEIKPFSFGFSSNHSCKWPSFFRGNSYSDTQCGFGACRTSTSTCRVLNQLVPMLSPQ